MHAAWARVRRRGLGGVGQYGMSGLERAVWLRASFLSPMMLKVGDTRPLPSMLLTGRNFDCNCSRKRPVPRQSPTFSISTLVGTRRCKNGPTTSPRMRSGTQHTT